MDLDEIKTNFDIILKNTNKLYNLLLIDKKKLELQSYEKETFGLDFYKDQERSSYVLQQIKILKEEISKFKELENINSDILIYLEILNENFDKDLFINLKQNIDKSNKLLQSLEIATLLSKEFDLNNAYVTIHPGAGGTESQDFVDMLLRMYTKWAEKNNFLIEILDLQQAQDAGIKSVSFLLKGRYAYGYFKAEKGVHRLVRISPFDSNSRRHTSFAAVDVIPQINDDVEVDINTQDLQIDTYRASGAGGQHVNKTESAIRIKHIPTGIVVTCQNERSQLQNKENAMKVLKSKIYEYEKQKRENTISNIKGKNLSNGFASQIRSYVFCPYTLVKDHRTGYEVGNVEAVFNGKIDDFIIEYLKYTK